MHIKNQYSFVSSGCEHIGQQCNIITHRVFKEAYNTGLQKLWDLLGYTLSGASSEQTTAGAFILPLDLVPWMFYDFRQT